MTDIPYNRPIGRKQYKSIPKHFSTARNRHAKWIDVNTERLTFDNADYGGFNHIVINASWENDDGNMWGFLQGFSIVGKKGEQFGYFENPNNPALQWHGFPVTPFSKGRYSISDNLLERWAIEGVIDEEDIPTIKNKRKLG